MKPHRLEFDAFGPYAGHEEIDFDALAELGLFVVSGPTGSGKSSIFNALCWALYGSFPGEFADDRDIRSQHAAPADPCQVDLEFTAGGARWRVSRRAAFERPKKRGKGTTPAPAEATLSWFRAGEWIPSVSKIREVNERCEELVGLDLQQFQRVVLLPQGGFARVLNAETNERQNLLRTLFSSVIYERAVDRLKAQAKQARDAISVQVQTRDAQLGIAAASLGRAIAAVGGEWEPRADLERSELDKAMSTISKPLLKAATKKSKLAKKRLAVVSETLIEARATAEAQERLARYQLELEGLEAKRADALAARAEAETAAAAAIVQSDYESEQQLLRVAQEQSSLRGQLHEDFDGLGVGDKLSEVLTQDALHESGKQVETLRTAILRLIESAEDLTKRRQQHSSAQKELSEERSAQQAAQASVEKLQAEVENTADKVEKSRTRSQRRPVDELSHESAVKARERYAAWKEASETAVESATRAAVLGGKLTARRGEQTKLNEAVSASASKASSHATDLASAEQLAMQVAAAKRLVDLEEELLLANDQVTDAKRHHTEQLRSYDAASASRLAEGLVDGEPCLVCGSLEHPAPARDDAESTIQLSDVEAALHVQTESSERQYSLLSQRAAQQETLKGREDPSVTTLRHLLVAAEAQLAKSAAAVEDAERLTSELQELEKRIAQLDTDSRDLTAVASSQQVRAETLAAELDQLATSSLTELEAAEEVAARSLQEADEATAELALQRVQLDELEKRLVAETGVAETLTAQVIARSAQLDQELKRLKADEQAQAAVVGDTVLDSESHKLAEAAVVLSSLVEQLKACDLSAAAHATQAKSLALSLGKSPFEALGQLEAALRDATQIDQLNKIHEEWLSRTKELVTLVTELQEKDLPQEAPDLVALEATVIEAEAASTTLAKEVAEAEANLGAVRSALSDMAEIAAEVARARTHAELLAHVAEVSSGRNDKRIPLESWVLSAYLREVVSHANLHLLPMSSGRYRLAVAEETLDRRAKAGLDIEVHDEHTGRRRSAQSLSGGETFQASLSLALGLADVVGAGNSALHFDCVFVDEGFGSLDPDALDRAIDVLDGLRTRGALVGVITHVPALKDVLPVGIEVKVNADGSGSTLQQLV
jgi:DNA repair protein SbcC/Rad50